MTCGMTVFNRVHLRQSQNFYVGLWLIENNRAALRGCLLMAGTDADPT